MIEYKIRNIRTLLLEGFKIQDFHTFFLEEKQFKPLSFELGATANQTQIVNNLLQFAQRHLIIETLLTWCRVKNPKRYEFHQPYFDESIKKRIKVYELLLTLNYKEQTRTFRRFLKQPAKTGFFLVYGPEGGGQRWLINKLFRQFVTDYTLSEQIKWDAAALIRAPTVSVLWERVATRVGLGSRYNHSEIVEKVCDWCQTKPVVFILNGLNRLDLAYFETIIKEFWTPFVQIAQRRGLKYELLFFALDEQDTVNDWQFDYHQYPNLLSLAVEANFTFEIICAWLTEQSDDPNLPVEFLEDIDRQAQAFIEESYSTLPEDVLYQICKRLNYNFHEGVDKWLIL